MQIGGTRLVYASPGSGLIRAGKKIFGASVGKYKLDASAGKHKLGSRAGKYQLGARARAGGQAEGRGPSRGPGTKQRAGGREIQIPYQNKISFR